jgi:RNA polymerase sigma factor (sigma-70 family)
VVAKMSHKVVCLNTGDIFNSMVDVLNWLKEHGVNMALGSVGGISLCCTNDLQRALRHPITGEQLAWAYYEDYIGMTQNEIDEKVFIATKDAFHNSTYENMDRFADTFTYKNIHELNKETIEILLPIMEKMFSDRQKMVFREYYINGKNMREIAEEYGITTTRVGNLTKQIIKKITEQYTYEEFANLIK